MDYYYEIEIKQLITPNGNWEIVYDSDKGEQFFDDIVYFAVCDLRAKPFIGKTVDNAEEDCIGIILPVIWVQDEGLIPILTSQYLTPGEQQIDIRRKELHGVAL